MIALTLAKVFALGFCVGDIDILRKRNLATLSQKSGKLIVNMNPDVCLDCIENYRRW